MPNPPPPDFDRVYVLTDKGLRQLMAGDTSLADGALRLLVLIDGKLPLSRLVKHLHGVVEPELSAVASKLIFDGHMKPLSANAAKLGDGLGAVDFFTDSSEEESTPAGKKEQDFARALEEAQNLSMKLKQVGFCARIARRPKQKPRHAEGSAYSILVIEDNPNLASVTRKFLTLEGFVPRMAANREELVAELRKTPLPDLVLLDVHLPDADGFEVLALVRKHPAMQHLPVILLTGRTTKEDVMRGLLLGTDGYITKPFEFDVLISAMKAVLGRDAVDETAKPS